MHDNPTPAEFEDEMVRLGDEIRRLRNYAELSRSELASRTGLHINYIGAIERGEFTPTHRTLLRIARGLEMELSTVILYAEVRRHADS